MTDEEKILVCALVSDVAKPVPGSVISSCSECGQMVWVAPASMEIKFTRSICSTCALTSLPPGEVARATPEQVREIARELGVSSRVAQRLCDLHYEKMVRTYGR